MAGKSVNKVILLGNLGKDPEVKYTPQGTPVAKFSLATNERYKDKDGNWQDRTEWHNIVVWQRLAEIAGEYLKKGGKVYIEGRLQTRSWDDKTTNQKKYMTEVVASDLVLLGGRGEGRRRRRILNPRRLHRRKQQFRPARARARVGHFVSHNRRRHPVLRRELTDRSASARVGRTLLSDLGAPAPDSVSRKTNRGSLALSSYPRASS